jgi:hypothetical protein
MRGRLIRLRVTFSPVPVPKNEREHRDRLVDRDVINVGQSYKSAAHITGHLSISPRKMIVSIEGLKIQSSPSVLTPPLRPA